MCFLLFLLQTNSQGDKVRTLCLSYLTVLQKVANHVALLQTASTSKQQVGVDFTSLCDAIDIKLILYSVVGTKNISPILKGVRDTLFWSHFGDQRLGREI